MRKMGRNVFIRFFHESALCYLLARRRRLGEERLQDVAHGDDALVADGLGH